MQDDTFDVTLAKSNDEIYIWDSGRELVSRMLGMAHRRALALGVL